ncbi:MAG: cytochrome c biogenesis protein CcdA [Eubacteriaceae bacterium]|nr:cytochrome c biogenesis protein CcdA [Eubacteriaceae bacterium]
MDYLITFLEGIITFISPCLLPMLPIYISYFAGPYSDGKKKTAVINAMGFVSGFTLVFVAMGAFAGVMGDFLKEYKTAINVISGVIMILLGLNFMEIIRVPFINMSRRLKVKKVETGFLSSVIFGVIFSIGWTPCVGAFLGSALMLAASAGESIKGILMLLSFSLGLGIPFIASAILIDRLKSTFDFIKRNYGIINLISGGILIAVGILMITGYMGYLLSKLTF